MVYVPLTVGERVCDTDVVKEALAVAHTDPEGLTVGERLIVALPENVPDVVGLRDWEPDVV